MGGEVYSILVGTSGLALLLAVAIVVFAARGGPDQAQSPRTVVRAALVILVIQCGHFSEELATGFHMRFPELLGLDPWPAAFFVWFNLAWIAIWGLSIMALRSRVRAALLPLWFLALAGTANGLAHPVLAGVSRGYFPGLWTSPFVGIAGALLLHRLLVYTRR